MKNKVIMKDKEFWEGYELEMEIINIYVSIYSKIATGECLTDKEKELFFHDDGKKVF